MKKVLSAAILGTVALSSCSVLGSNKAAVSGNLKGFSPNQNLQIAVVGYNSGKYVVDGNQAQVIDKYLTSGFTLALPTSRTVPYGTYRLIVFRDANNNGSYDLGDTILSKDNGKLLVFAGRDDAYFPGTKYGWNIYNTANRDVQTTLLNNYDLEAVMQ